MKTEQMWAHIHNQVEDAEHARFEEQLAQAPEMKARYRDLQTMDKTLRALLPMAQRSEDELAAMILADWEQTGNQQAAADPQENSGPGKVIVLAPRGRNKAVAMTFRVLALAACLMIAVGIYNLSSQGLRWQAPTFDVSGYRGEASDPAAAGQTAALTEMEQQLKQQIAEHYDAQPTPRSWADRVLGRGRWEISSRWQVLPQNHIYVQVEARPTPGQPPSLTWEEYLTPESQAAQLEALTLRIAGDLCNQLPEPTLRP